MKFEKLGEDIYIPHKEASALKNKSNLKFNYYLNSRINGNLIDLDITSKLFDGDKMYVRKSCYRVSIGDIEHCVKVDIIDHMRALGVSSSDIPNSLKNSIFTNYNKKSNKATA